MRAGDCDDINGILLPALLGTIGVRTRLVTVATDPKAPAEFTHIYPEAWLGGQWIPIDAAMKNPVWGTAPARYTRKRIWSTTDSSYRDLAGLGDFWSSFTQALPALTSTGVQIANAAGASGFPMPAGQVALSPSGQVIATQPAATAASSTDNTWIWASVIGAGAVLVAALIGRSH